MTEKEQKLAVKKLPFTENKGYEKGELQIF